jgi:hypothetical protein
MPVRGIWHGLCRPCRYEEDRIRRRPDAEKRVAWRYSVRPERPKKHEEPRVEIRTILDPELDHIRKVLAMAPPELSGEADKLAFLRGFMRGAAHGLKETSYIEQHQDLVFRIASELRKHRYEDRVSFGYEALLACSRSGISDRELIANEIREKIQGEKGERWLLTGFHGVGPDGDFDLIAQTEDYRETTEPQD